MPKRKTTDDESCSSEKRGRDEVDLYTSFMDFVMEPPMRDHLKQSKRSRTIVKRQVPGLGPITEYKGVKLEPDWSEPVSPKSLGWNERLQETFSETVGTMEEDQQALFEIVNRYVDVHAISKDVEYRNIYIAHALNHLIRSRNTIIANKRKMAELQSSGTLGEDDIEGLRDQGFARPLILVLCPLKKDAYDIVNRLRQLIYGESEKQDVWAKTRFETEYASEPIGELPYEMDEEQEYLLTGRNDDCFRMGISLSKKTLKLFEAFKNSDILLCSPLGLRMVLNGEEGSESHLVSNLQMVIIDKADILMQQNWEHLNLIFSHIGNEPSQIDTDISRVKKIYLDGDAKHYMQIMMFSKYQHELFSALMMEHSLNHRGLNLHQPKSEGTLEEILIPLCQELHRFDAASIEELDDARFKYFADNLASSLVMHSCLVIPSYYDFVRVRNHLKRMDESFVSCYEYAPKEKIKRARDMFYHARKNVLLVTERFYYYNRNRLRGIQQMMFYQLPSHPDFYSRMINMAQPKTGSRMKVSLLYSKYDRFRLQNTFGDEMAQALVTSAKKVHAIISE